MIGIRLSQIAGPVRLQVSLDRILGRKSPGGHSGSSWFIHHDADGSARAVDGLDAPRRHRPRGRACHLSQFRRLQLRRLDGRSTQATARRLSFHEGGPVVGPDTRSSAGKIQAGPSISSSEVGGAFGVESSVRFILRRTRFRPGPRREKVFVVDSPSSRWRNASVAGTCGRHGREGP